MKQLSLILCYHVSEWRCRWWFGVGVCVWMCQTHHVCVPHHCSLPQSAGCSRLWLFWPCFGTAHQTLIAPLLMAWLEGRECSRGSVTAFVLNILKRQFTHKCKFFQPFLTLMSFRICLSFFCGTQYIFWKMFKLFLLIQWKSVGPNINIEPQ